MKPVRWKNLVATTVIACVIICICIGLIIAQLMVYQRASRVERAGLIGQLIDTDGAVSEAEILRTLQRGPTAAEASLGEARLRDAGVVETDFGSTSAVKFATSVSLIVLGGSVGLSVTIMGFFLYQDYKIRQRIVRLTNYLQELKNQTYDLRLDENTEDELSFLGNEIYKLTVLLQESAELNRAQRLEMETALADISHQLRTPLTSIQVMIDNILDDTEMSPAVRHDFLESIASQVSAMADLVTTLLNLAKFDNGTIKLHRRSVRIGALLDRVCQNLAILADLRDVTLECSGDLAANVKLDPRWQTEALTNIVKNCLEHSGRDAVVRLHVIAGPLFVCLEISDQGDGIPPDQVKHIFERFYKASNSSPEGVGIGLAFAKAIITAEQGQVSAQSTLGQGTIFTVRYLKS